MTKLENHEKTKPNPKSNEKNRPHPRTREHGGWSKKHIPKRTGAIARVSKMESRVQNTGIID